MRICVLADTHLNIPLSLKAIKEMEQADFFIHLGDCCADAEKIHEETGLPYKAVRGNKDWRARAPYMDLIELEGIKIMAVHGHHELIDRNDPDDLRQEKFEKMARLAKENGAGIVLYGHDHLAEKFYIDEILFFNPGEMVYGAKYCTYGVLEITNREFTLEHAEVKPDESL